MSRAPKKVAGSRTRRATEASKKKAKASKKQLLLRATDTVKRQKPKPNSAQRKSPADRKQTAGLPKELLAASASDRTSAPMPADTAPAGTSLPLAAFWSPMEMLFRQQALMAALMLNVVRTQQLAWKLARLPSPQRSS